LFEDSDIDKHSYDEIPLDRDCCLMSEIYMKEYDEALGKMLRQEDVSPYEVGCVGFVGVRKINKNSLELSWYVNISTRFHEVSISLPKDKIKICVSCEKYDIKPYIFVDHEWLEQLYLREYSVFALIDAIDVRAAIKDNLLTKQKLIKLRDKIDQLAEKNSDISFISFADSLILKSNWDVGYHRKGAKSSYRPEIFLNVIKELERIYKEVLGLKIYAVLTQGSNKYYGETLLHISKSKNHICLNSLGVPFAELRAIESAVKDALKSGVHPQMQVYMDEQFYHSLSLKYEYEKNKKPKNTYSAIMQSHKPNYYYASCDVLIENLRDLEDKH
jgi:hypothetical protein